MTLAQVLMLIRATQSQQPAVVSQPSSIVVNVPEIKMPPPNVTISELKLPEQKAPIVNVAAARVIVPATDAPNVTVNVDPTPVTVINKVNVPTAKSIKVNRDGEGKLSGIEVQKD